METLRIRLSRRYYTRSRPSIKPGVAMSCSKLAKDRERRTIPASMGEFPHSFGAKPLAKSGRACFALAMRPSVFFTLPLLLLAEVAPAADSLPALDLKVAFPELTFTRPLWMVEPPDGSRRFFVVEQRGKVLILLQDRNG